MITNYKFKNYKSFANETEFSMLAGSGAEHEDNYLNVGNEKISKVKIIYGANASGKTSFIHSIEFIKVFMLFSNYLLDGDKIKVAPYKFRKEAANEISEFALNFIKDGVKYAYSFSCNKDCVVDERLDAFYTARPTNIFLRTNTDTYTFNKDVKELTAIKTKNTKNKLFLATAATWNYEAVKPVIDYIKNDIVVAYGTEGVFTYDIDYVIKNNDMEEFKSFCIEFLNDADINITNFSIDSKKLSELRKDSAGMAKFLDRLDDENPEKLKQLSDKNFHVIKTMHTVKHGDVEENYELNLLEESLGTIQMFKMAPILFYVFKCGKTLFIDEIDRSLHPLLVKNLVKKFLNKELNINNAQLICNTHDTNLLDLDFMRRDDIVFVEKNFDTGISELFGLSDFSVRKNENIEKAYLMGRFGAIPFLKED